MVLKYEKDPTITKKKCQYCERKIVIEFKEKSKPLTCMTCKSLGQDASKFQRIMALSSGISDLTTLSKKEKML